MHWLFARCKQPECKSSSCPYRNNEQVEDEIEVTNAAVRLAKKRILENNLTKSKSASLANSKNLQNGHKQVSYDAKPDNVLFRTFRQTNEPNLREFLFFRWLQRANRCAKRYYARNMPYAPILSLDDLESTASVGLLKAIDKFDPDVNDSFEGFMQEKIKWTIIDELRSMQDFPRIIAKNRRELKHKLHLLGQMLQKKITLDDIREHLGEETYRMASDKLFFCNVFNQSLDNGSSKSLNQHPVNLSETVLDDAAELPSKVMAEDMHNLVFKFLTGVHRSIIFQYYFFGMTVTDIASALHISTTQVSDKRQEALSILRRKIMKQ